jgi:hypothetical protein
MVFPGEGSWLMVCSMGRVAVVLPSKYRSRRESGVHPISGCVGCASRSDGFDPSGETWTAFRWRCKSGVLCAVVERPSILGVGVRSLARSKCAFNSLISMSV